MKQKVFDFLRQTGIAYELTEHPAVYTMEDPAVLELSKLGPIPKNLFLKDGKGRQHFLVTAAADTQIDLKILGEKLGVKKLGFASADRLAQYLGVTAGCVSPFGLLNDSENAVTVVLDSKLTGLTKLGVHPNVHDATVWLSFEDLQRAILATGHQVQILEF